MNDQAEMVEIIAILTHELGVALELSFERHEFLQLWPEAIDGLSRAKVVLTENGCQFPGAANNVLSAAKPGFN
jgi:hypothetical protein